MQVLEVVLILKLNNDCSNLTGDLGINNIKINGRLVDCCFKYCNLNLRLVCKAWNESIIKLKVESLMNRIKSENKKNYEKLLWTLGFKRRNIMQNSIKCG